MQKGGASYERYSRACIQAMEFAALYAADEQKIRYLEEHGECLIREKALRCLDEEIPHGIAVTIEKMKWRKDIVDIDATIICERESHKGIIIGRQGSMLKKIGTEARKDIEKMLDSRVNLQLWVKVKKDWRDSDFLLKNFGYNQKDYE